MIPIEYVACLAGIGLLVAFIGSAVGIMICRSRLSSILFTMGTIIICLAVLVYGVHYSKGPLGQIKMYENTAIIETRDNEILLDIENTDYIEILEDENTVYLVKVGMGNKTETIEVGEFLASDIREFAAKQGIPLAPGR